MRSQTLLEAFYRVHLTPSTSLTANLQVIFDPASNSSTSTVWVPGLRFVMAF